MVVLQVDKVDDGSDKAGGAIYWKRCSLARFSRVQCDIRDHDFNWKQLFFECLVQEMVEKYIPGVRTVAIVD